MGKRGKGGVKQRSALAEHQGALDLGGGDKKQHWGWHEEGNGEGRRGDGAHDTT